MSRIKLPTSDPVFDYVILGSHTHCAMICHELVSRGFAVLMLTDSDLGEGTCSHEKHFPLSVPNFFKLSNKEIHQSLQKIHALAPIYAPRKRFLVSNMGLESLFSSLKLVAFEKQSKQSSDWKHYQLNREELKTKEPGLDTSEIAGTESVTVYEINEQHLTLELCKNAMEHHAQLLNHTDLLQCESKNGIFHLTLWDHVANKQINVQTRKILSSKKPKYADRLGARLPASEDKNESAFSFLQISSEKFDLRQNHFIQLGGKHFLASLSTGLLTFGVSSGMRSESENQAIIIDFCTQRLGLKIEKEEILHTWKSSKTNNVTPENQSLPNVYWLDDLHAEYAFSNKDKFLNQLGIKTAGTTTGWKNCLFENISPYSIVEACDAKFDEAKQTNIKSNAFKKLFYRYGHDMEIITEYSYEYHRKYPAEEVWLRAEVRYCAEKERCCTAEDFFSRRSAILFTSVQQQDLKNAVEDEITKYFSSTI